MTPLQRPGDETPRPLDEEAGDRAAFDAELAQHRDGLFRFLRGRLGDTEAAADLTQEALSRMMKYRDAPEIEDRRLMLYRIANNLLLEVQRVRHRHQADRHVPLEEAGQIGIDQPTVEEIANARQVIDRLLTRTIAGLPTRCRIAFLLHRIDGLTQLQTAARMGISVKMVERHIARALEACRADLGDREI
ncbi:RNA polymerase sigma factor [Luteimonas sp. BDR2-5]|uniref:RNA polymerase sigma factor n=1 Tax=Proluteimonas luteida TaxID=2878685 RepID=UPI001E540D42|nr:RNA polymerase sigma factor [Luteimonas sp. BDR2-5]MCD9026717.1 RNA polymerase sigma factor [Luteimonas sp. BDR2-5]